MSWFHKHVWKEIARTYAEPVHYEGRLNGDAVSVYRLNALRIDAARGLTTILWECEDPSCRALRKETMLGKSVDKAPDEIK